MKTNQKFKFKTLFLFTVFFLVTPFLINAFSKGEVKSFHVESSYDVYSRNKVDAVLYEVTDRNIFYIEESWLKDLSNEKRQKLNEIIYSVGVDFKDTIYPEMTSIFGDEPRHSINHNEGKITVLFHRMKSNAGGYFNSGDQYSVYQYGRSNETNMIYINTDFIVSDLLKGFLAHEFMHMITFNQKDKIHGVSEEIWLNEARAEYMPTFFDYDDLGKDSNILRRKNAFINNPKNSLTEWLNKNEDYGSINMFVHYLVDHYGVEILADSLKSDKVGIKSINYALEKNGFKENFSQIFTDWTIAVLVNNCSLNEKYCYLKEELKNLMIVPSTHNLPSSHGGMFASRNSTKNWAGNWWRIVGEKNDLIFEFEGEEGVNFTVPYILCDVENVCEMGLLDLKDNRTEIAIENFGEEYNSFYFIPSLQDKIEGFNRREESYFYDWRVSSVLREEEKEEKKDTEEDIDRKNLIIILSQMIKELRQEISRLQKVKGESIINNCEINNNLYFGLRNNEEVKCLQKFLKNEKVYPEGYVTGNFLGLTKQAVINFQEKYSDEILSPLGLTQGTGYVGPQTIKKIKEIKK